MCCLLCSNASIEWHVDWLISWVMQSQTFYILHQRSVNSLDIKCKRTQHKRALLSIKCLSIRTALQTILHEYRSNKQYSVHHKIKLFCTMDSNGFVRRKWWSNARCWCCLFILRDSSMIHDTELRFRLLINFSLFIFFIQFSFQLNAFICNAYTNIAELVVRCYRPNVLCKHIHYRVNSLRIIMIGKLASNVLRNRHSP